MYLTYDNGGRSADRYTVFPYRRSRDQYVRQMYLALNDSPEHPTYGFSQWGAWGTPDPRIGKRIPFNTLPEHVRAHVLRRIGE